MDVYDEGGRFGGEFHHCEGREEESIRVGSCIRPSKVLLVEMYIQISTEYLRHHDHTTSR